MRSILAVSVAFLIHKTYTVVVYWIHVQQTPNFEITHGFLILYKWLFRHEKAFCAEDSKYSAGFIVLTLKMILKIGNPEALEQPYQIIRLYLKLSEPIQSTRRL